ncbi:MAG: hypothetical protein WCJ94_05730 [bacterium]
MKKTLFLIVAVIFSMTVIFAGQPITPGSFIDVGLARPAAMAGAFTAIADDASAVFYNPAGIVNSKYKDFTFMYTNYLGVVPYNITSFIWPINADRGVGFGLIVSGDSLFDEKTFLLSYSEKLDWLLGNIGIKGLCLGGSFKLQFAGFGNNSNGSADRVQGSAGGFGLDLGILYAINPELKIGAFVRDAVSAMWWGANWNGIAHNSMQGVGLTTDLGASYKIKDFIASVTLSDLDKLKIGIEKTLFDYVDIRGGFSQTMDFESYREYMIGIGIGHFEFGEKKEFSMNIDFAYMFLRLDNSYNVQCSFKFL